MTPKLSDRLSKLVPMLASDKDFEVLSTVYAIQRSLASENFDFHDLAKRIISNGLQKSFSDMVNEATASWQAYEARRATREAAARAAEAEPAEAERAERAERYAAEKAAKAAARAAERATPEFKARVAQRRRDALARKAAEAEYAEAERKKVARIAAEGPMWGDIGDVARRVWVGRILRDPSAKLDPSTTEALNGIDAALAPTSPSRRGRRLKPKITWEMITPAWIAEFEKAARDHTMRQRSRGMCP
jgi:hypothetical protein